MTRNRLTVAELQEVLSVFNPETLVRLQIGKGVRILHQSSLPKATSARWVPHPEYEGVETLEETQQGDTGDVAVLVLYDADDPDA